MSFQVLDLFADLFDLGFQDQDLVCYGDVVGFGAYGI